MRRLEQIRRKEWRLAHQNPETGDYDEYGAFPGLSALENETRDKKQARKQRRQKRKQNSEKKKKTKQQNKKKASKGSKDDDRGNFSRNELNITYAS